MRMLAGPSLYLVGDAAHGRSRALAYLAVRSNTGVVPSGD